MSRTQHFGIKFPFTQESDEKTILDLASNPIEGVKSELMHLIFTPKGQRLRNPDFGTRLIQFIFEPNDNQTWGDVEMEVKETVSQYIPNCRIESIMVYDVENGNGIVVDIRFKVTNSNNNNTYQLVTRL